VQRWKGARTQPQQAQFTSLRESLRFRDGRKRALFIPLWSRFGHFRQLIFDPHERIVHYFDSMQNGSSDDPFRRQGWVAPLLAELVALSAAMADEDRAALSAAIVGENGDEESGGGEAEEEEEHAWSLRASSLHVQWDSFQCGAWTVEMAHAALAYMRERQAAVESQGLRGFVARYFTKAALTLQLRLRGSVATPAPRPVTTMCAQMLRGISDNVPRHHRKYRVPLDALIAAARRRTRLLFGQQAPGQSAAAYVQHWAVAATHHWDVHDPAALHDPRQGTGVLNQIALDPE
jgi:hypothetical protein